MFKGIPQNMRDHGWHTRHMKKLKRRKAIAKQHILMNQRGILSSTLDNLRAEKDYKRALKREKGKTAKWYGAIYWFFKRLWSRIKGFKILNYAR